MAVKFFIPGNGPKSSEDIYSWIVRYIKAMIDVDIEPARIFSISYIHEGQQFSAQVGEIDPRTSQLVVAILRSNAYLICTPYFGVKRGEPISIPRADVRQVEYFEGLDKALEKLEMAVKALDNADGSLLHLRLTEAASLLESTALDDFPADMASDFLSLKHKLTWKGSLRDTFQQMSESEARDIAYAIRSLYVDILLHASQPGPLPNSA